MDVASMTFEPAPTRPRWKAGILKNTSVLMRSVSKIDLTDDLMEIPEQAEEVAIKKAVVDDTIKQETEVAIKKAVVNDDATKQDTEVAFKTVTKDGAFIFGS